MVPLDIAGAFNRVWHSDLQAIRHTKDIEGGLLTQLVDYLQGRSLWVVVSIGASPVEHLHR